MTFNAYMHERNLYRNQPDFAKLAVDFPEFRKYIIPDAKGQKVRIDFSNTDALRLLTKILLKKDFNLDIEIPEGFLIPTVPQRLNYILWVEDLLSCISQNETQKECINGIDIGTGACAIFSVLGAQKNGWKFVATESSEDAIIWAKKNIQNNNLQEYITVVKVNQGGSPLDKVLSSNADCFKFCMCNPPFFENCEEIRKKHLNSSETIADVAQKEEIFVKGGELDFVRSILKDSLVYKNRVCIFTSMFGKKKSFLQITKDLREIPDAKFTSTEFYQGNTVRWGVAWTFDELIQFQKEVKKKVKSKKAKPPLEYQIILNSSKTSHFDAVVKQTKTYLKSMEIYFTVVRSSQNFTELLLKSDKNTWTHQRRKRRELQRQKKGSENTDEVVVPVSSSENVKTIIKEDDIESLKLFHSEDVNLKKDGEEIENCDTQTSGPRSQEVSSGSISSDLELQHDVSLPNVSESEHTKDSLTVQSNKRKLDVDSDDSGTGKKVKLDDTENTETVPAESSFDKSDILNIKHETIPSCNVVSVHEQHPVSSPNDAEAISASETESVSSSGKVEELNDSHVDHKKTKNTEPEGIILYCHLQFIKGKNKIYVKMNCPPSADRNTMYQVFQLIKNKVN